MYVNTWPHMTLLVLSFLHCLFEEDRMHEIIVLYIIGIRIHCIISVGCGECRCG